ncbi:hypothetical protein VTN31DRAFT_4475 [Thermomyces dupontii]|uniref:uncharacterized protein n=1 Tax=Talaromyces thermophilus TaxID=28565 RepID=UPI003742600F
MADISEPEKRPAEPDPSLPPRLRYPTFPPLSRSVEEWLSQSRLATMSSTGNMQPEGQGGPSAGSLTESWATLSLSDMHSEDGAPSEQTDMLSLMDPSGPDDVASLDERESSAYGDEPEDADDEEAADDGRRSMSASQESLLPLFIRDDLAANQGSNMTIKQPPSESIEFPEPDQWPEVDQIELKHTIRILDDGDTDPNGCYQVISVHQTMTRDGLELNKPFRVLYAGNSEFRNMVLDKIGDVLVSSSTRSGTSSTDSSRYHVVPTSFGAGATPNFAELLPIHVQLVVDECVDASVDVGANAPSAVTLKFKNRPPCSSIWNGSAHVVQSDMEWFFPDLAIFFVSENDTVEAQRTRQLAHTFMATHEVPIMFISEEPLWMKEAPSSFPLDGHVLHVCLESRDPETGDTTVLRRYPIDIKTFESIAPAQLNRHLASLCEFRPKPTPNVAGRKQVLKPFGTAQYPTKNLLEAFLARAHEYSPVFRMVMLSILFATAVSLGYSGVRSLLAASFQRFAGSSNGDIATVPAATTTTVTLLSATKAVSTAVPKVELGRQYSSIDELAGMSSLLLEQQSKPGEFQFQVIGDCHIIIKEPAARRPPKFHVTVTRGDTVLPHELSKIFDGVYTLRLNREDAHGLINVKVTTKTQPVREQMVGFDLGTPWLKIENWKRAAKMVSSQVRQDLTHAQTELSLMYNRLSTDVQVWMEDVVQKSQVVCQEAERYGYDRVRLQKMSRDLIIKSRQVTDIMSRAMAGQFAAIAPTLAKMQVHSRTIQRDTEKAIRNLWDLVASRQIDKDFVTDFWQNLRKSETLARAQRAARALTQRA